MWSSGLKKRQKLGKLSKPLGTTTQVRGRTGLCCRLWYQLAWTVNSGVWASFKWDLRLVILSPRLVKGEHMTGCLGPGSDWCVPEFLCALLSMWWETLKCGQYGVTIKGCLVNWGYSYAGVLLAWVSGGREMWGEAAVGLDAGECSKWNMAMCVKISIYAYSNFKELIWAYLNSFLTASKQRWLGAIYLQELGKCFCREDTKSKQG